MPYRNIQDIKDNFYHIYNRGNNYQKIFFDEKNYDFFLTKLLFLFDGKISLIAFCLMPNHYHLLIKIIENYNLSKIMQRFSTSYTKSINKAYNRVGHLFQGRYKIKYIPNNEYLLHLSRYIHLNPVRANLVRKPENWRFSSYNDYLKEKGRYNLEKDIILDQINDYAGFVKSYQENQSYFIKDLIFKNQSSY